MKPPLMLGLRRKDKVGGKSVWAFQEFDVVDNRWRHVEGTPGQHNYIFPDTRSIIQYLNENTLDATEWEILKETDTKEKSQR